MTDCIHGTPTYEYCSKCLGPPPEAPDFAAEATETKLRARIAELEAALQRIADAPAWGAPDRWETTPAEIRQFARATLKGCEK